jgi:hypothetical protein
MRYLWLNPFCYIVNAGGGTRSDSEFRRPEMWALDGKIARNIWAVVKSRRYKLLVIFLALNDNSLQK